MCWEFFIYAVVVNVLVRYVIIFCVLTFIYAAFVSKTSQSEPKRCTLEPSQQDLSHRFTEGPTYKSCHHGFIL